MQRRCNGGATAQGSRRQMFSADGVAKGSFQKPVAALRPGWLRPLVNVVWVARKCVARGWGLGSLCQGTNGNAGGPLLSVVRTRDAFTSYTGTHGRFYPAVMHTHARTHAHTHSLSLSLSLTHTHTHTHAHIHTHARTHAQGQWHLCNGAMARVWCGVARRMRAIVEYMHRCVGNRECANAARCAYGLCLGLDLK